MGSLRQQKTGRIVVLESENVVGRSLRCTFRFESTFVSSIHASLRFTPIGWEVKDLGSTNGTFLDGVRLEWGQARLVAEHQTIAFGSLEDAWEVLDAAPPQATAIAEDGTQAPAHDDLIAVPSTDNPLVTIYRGGGGDWFLERSGEAVQLVHNDDQFEAASKVWRIHLPDAVLQTNSASIRDIRKISLAFTVSSDEEHVDLEARADGVRVDLGRSRAHNYMLLTLARRRFEDAKVGLPDTSCGWMYQDDLAKALGVPEDAINVDVFRIRRRFARHFANAAEVIERRTGCRQLRLSIADIEVRRS